jgi:hypothetical protein
MADAANDDCDSSTRSKEDQRENPQLVRVRLAQIAGIHQAIDQLYEDLSIPPLRFAAKHIPTEDDLLSLSAKAPIHIARVHRQLRCVGNIRMYLALRSLPSLQQEIYCIEVPAVDVERIRSEAIRELLYLPAIAGVHGSEIKLLADVARRAHEANLWIPDTRADAFIAKLYGIDRRQLARQIINPVQDTVAGAEPEENISADTEDGLSKAGSIPTSEDSASSSESTNPTRDPQKRFYEVRKGQHLLGHFVPASNASLELLIARVSTSDVVISEPSVGRGNNPLTLGMDATPPEPASVLVRATPSGNRPDNEP